METITAQELKKKIDDREDITIINALGKEQYQQKHIPGSINIPVDEVEEKASQVLPEDKSKEIIVYCASKDCQASPKEAEKLEQMGYRNVKDFEGGIAEWQEQGYEFEGNDT